MKPYFLKTGVLFGCLSLLMTCPGSTSVAAERSHLLGSPRTSHIDYGKLAKQQNDVISAHTKLLAEKAGLISMMEKLERLRNSEAKNSLDYLTCKQELTESILLMSWDLRTTIARIDQEIASTNEIFAHLAERRDKAVRYNTYADFISGGITGLVGGGLQLARIPSISPDIIDTAEGAVQTSLASWAFKQQMGEKRLEQGIPNMLSHLIDKSDQSSHDFPASVWEFLNLPVDNGTNTVANRLVQRWLQLDFCLKHSGHKQSSVERRKRIANTLKTPQEIITIDVLEDRIAMLTDLRSCVQHMDFTILELLQFLQGKKKLA